MGRFIVHFRSFTFNLTQVKVKKVGMPHRVNFNIKKIILTRKYYGEDSIIIAMN